MPELHRHDLRESNLVRGPPTTRPTTALIVSLGTKPAPGPRAGQARLWSAVPAQGNESLLRSFSGGHRRFPPVAARAGSP